MVSKWRAIAWSPPAVFSRYTGTLALQLVERFAPALKAVVEVVVVGDVTTVDDHRGGADVGCRVAGLLQDLARRDAHAIVRGRNVYQVGGVHVYRQGCRFQALRVLARLGRLPALRVAEEDLHHVGTLGLRCGEWILGADM